MAKKDQNTAEKPALAIPTGDALITAVAEKSDIDSEIVKAAGYSENCLKNLFTKVSGYSERRHNAHNMFLRSLGCAFYAGFLTAFTSLLTIRTVSSETTGNIIAAGTAIVTIALLNAYSASKESNMFYRFLDQEADTIEREAVRNMAATYNQLRAAAPAPGA